MKGGSREAKGHKSTGGGRMWYGKRETQIVRLFDANASSRAPQDKPWIPISS